MIEVPQAAIELAKRFEGFHRVPKHDPGRAHPYVCPAGYWTIGYGHLCDPKHPPITEGEAEAYLAQDLRAALAATLRYCPVLAAEPEGRLAAIVDFTFNLGAGRLQTSTLRRRVNERNWIAAATELRRWIYGGGKVLPGLVARRAAEVTWLLGNTWCKAGQTRLAFRRNSAFMSSHRSRSDSMNPRFRKAIVDDVTAANIDDKLQSSLLELFEYAMKSVAPTLVREARFDTTDFATSRQRGCEGFAMLISRARADSRDFWFGAFQRGDQRLDVVGHLE